MIETRVLAPETELKGRVQVPPSKSYTHRAVTMASLAAGKSVVSNPLFSRDTNATVAACKAFGATITQRDSTLVIEGIAPKTPEDVVNVENSGTTLRFMTSILSVPEQGYSILTGDASIRRRPMQPLLDTLNELGVEARSARGNGCAPVIVKGDGMRGGNARIRGDVSSQFISSLLISTPMARQDTTLEVDEAVSRPYIDATLALSRRFGVEVRRYGYDRFVVGGGQQYKPSDFPVPADFSSASFVMAAVALVGGTVELVGLDQRLPQGDSLIIEVLRRMGVEVDVGEGSVSVHSGGDALKGGRFVLSDTPDLLPVVATLALKCSSPVEMVGVAHARYKETDRIAVVAKELSKVGARIEERKDGLWLEPVKKKLTPALLDAHDDHRMFMAFSLASMLIPEGAPVVGVESLDVSYPAFLADMKALGASVRSGP